MIFIWVLILQNITGKRKKTQTPNFTLFFTLNQNKPECSKFAEQMGINVFSDRIKISTAIWLNRFFPRLIRNFFIESNMAVYNLLVCI